jgi:hypothetical protein
MAVHEKYGKRYYNIKIIDDPHFKEYEGKVIINKMRYNWILLDLFW